MTEPGKKIVAVAAAENKKTEDKVTMHAQSDHSNRHTLCGRDAGPSRMLTEVTLVDRESAVPKKACLGRLSKRHPRDGTIAIAARQRLSERCKVQS